jgi:hypothetical protein
MGGNMCGVIATICKNKGCDNMARYDLYCFVCGEFLPHLEGEEE